MEKEKPSKKTKVVQMSTDDSKKAGELIQSVTGELPYGVMTIKQLEQLSKDLQELMDLKGEKFSYFIVKNLNLIGSIQKEFHFRVNKLRPTVTPRITEYLEREHQLYESFAVVGPDGNKHVKGVWNIESEKVPEMKEAVKKFEEDYKDEVQAIKEFGQKITIEENKPVNVNLYRIKKEFIPEEITARLRMPIEFLID